MAALRRDLSYAFRRLSRSPGLAFAAIISIGLGIAGNATIFSVVSTFLLRPVPVGDPSTLMGLYTAQSGSCCGNNVSWLLYADVRDQTKSFSGLAAYYPMMPASIGGYGEPERVWGELATANFFQVAQVPMTLGRGFARDEERASVLVLSYRLWQRRFGADAAIVGKVITLSGRPFTVVGVAPASFRGLDILGSDLWIPLGNQEQLMPKVGDRLRTNTWLEVAGRLKAGVTRAQAEAELDTLAQHLAKAYPQTPKNLSFRLEQAGTLPPDQKQAVTAFLVALSVVVFLVLCIACGNITNLLLAQAYSRHREMAVRLALGATRAQLQRQMLLESLLLAIGGGLFGFCLSLLATSALSAFHLPIPVPIDLTIHVDWRVLVYSFVLSIVTGLLFGMPPAWVASRPAVAMALKGEDALAIPGRRWNLRSLLVTAQVATSLVLLCATGLFLRSLAKASSIDIGFRSRGILMMNIDPQLHGYTVERATQFLAELRQRVEAIPGVASVTLTDPVPLSMDGRWDDFHTESRPNDQNTVVDLYMVTPGYFATMGIARVAGRDFAANDNASDSKVAVVNEAFAQRLFHGENPIGQRVTGTGATYEIIGIVKNIKSRTLGEGLKPVLYRSVAQDLGRDPDFRGISLLVRSDTNPASLEREVRLVIHSLDPAMAIFNVETMEEHLRDALFLPRLAGVLFGIFGLTGLVLASVGLYGVMSYSVSRRTREIGIRLALGAPIASIQRLIIGQGMMLAFIAVALGLPIAFALAKFAGSILYGVRPHDIVTFTFVPLSLTAIAFLACWIPAHRVLKVDPQTALRRE
jgi:predicted permease